MSKLALIACLAACGPTPVGNKNGVDANGGGGGDDGPGPAIIDAGNCASESVKAMSSPLDLYVMLDQSGSMAETVSGGGTKWTAVTTALKTFLAQPNLDGISIGMQYFGLETGSSGNDSCTASTYATAAVEIAAMPGAASALTTSINGHSPTSGTPTSAALQGAINHASSWASAHTGHVSAVVLATDGEPEECDTKLADIDAIAAAGLAATPKVTTFVIGVGSSLSNLNGIAAAGGSTSAFLVDTGGNVNTQFLAAMNAIRNSASCTYQIPVPTDGSAADPTQVNVVFTPTGGAATTIPNVGTKAMCPASGNGWYYDTAAAPTSILLCDSTCGTIQADGTGTVDIALGCQTVFF